MKLPLTFVSAAWVLGGGAGHLGHHNEGLKSMGFSSPAPTSAVGLAQTPIALPWLQRR